ncbi:hypothetical protein ACCC88_20765 [Sphingomonas sp. Sphisp140]
MKKKIAVAALFALSALAPSVALAFDDPLPPGCFYVLGKLICVDMPME